jgi:GDP-4-dehydro-6-deoxy-D-mannose reductase
LHPYGVSKVATDLLAYQYWAGFGLDAIRVCIFNCTGPRKVGDALSDFVRRTVWLERHPEARKIRIGNLETRRDDRRSPRFQSRSDPAARTRQER